MNTQVLLSSINKKLQANRSSFEECDALGTKDMCHIERNHILYSNVWPNCGRFRIFSRLPPWVLLVFLYCESGIAFLDLNFDWIHNKEFICLMELKNHYSFLKYLTIFWLKFIKNTMDSIPNCIPYTSKYHYHPFFVQFLGKCHSCMCNCNQFQFHSELNWSITGKFMIFCMKWRCGQMRHSEHWT